MSDELNAGIILLATPNVRQALLSKSWDSMPSARSFIRTLPIYEFHVPSQRFLRNAVCSSGVSTLVNLEACVARPSPHIIAFLASP